MMVGAIPSMDATDTVSIGPRYVTQPRGVGTVESRTRVTCVKSYSLDSVYDKGYG